MKLRMLTLLTLTTGCLTLAALEARAQAAPAAEPRAEPAETMLSLVKKGGPVMIPLGLASILAFAIALERLIALRATRILPPGFTGRLKTLWQEDRTGQKALALCGETTGPLSRIFKTALQNLSLGEEAVEKAIEDSGGREVDRMKRSIRALAHIASLSPLLGLLGTVYGLIDAFQVAAAGGMGKTELLAKGIYEALITTAAGLTIAIPVLIAYQYLDGKIDRIVDEMDELGLDFIHTCFRAPPPESKNEDAP